MSHSKLIRELVEALRGARQQITSLMESVEAAEESAYLAHARADRARSEAARAERDAMTAADDARSREFARDEAVRQLTRARDHHDSWEEERAIKRLRAL